ncbi:menaquinone-specific isochorismate synthase [Vibrio sp. JCM 18904]|nr:menaquinone-specific isochorismate synthase [Vibrio sp. JCM 18904]
MVDDIIDRLLPHSEMVEVEAEPSLVRLRKVQHLKRNIHASLRAGDKWCSVVIGASATAAVAGLPPRQESMQFILDNEPFARAGTRGQWVI